MAISLNSSEQVGAVIGYTRAAAESLEKALADLDLLHAIDTQNDVAQTLGAQDAAIPDGFGVDALALRNAIQSLRRVREDITTSLRTQNNQTRIERVSFNVVVRGRLA